MKKILAVPGIAVLIVLKAIMTWLCVIAVVGAGPFLLALGTVAYSSLPLEENHMRQGKDTVAFWRDGRYAIGRVPTGLDRDSRYSREYVLQSGNPEEGELMRHVFGYFLSGEKAYLISEGGECAILDFPSETYAPVERLEDLSAEEQDIFNNMRDYRVLYENMRDFKMSRENMVNFRILHQLE